VKIGHPQQPLETAAGIRAVGMRATGLPDSPPPNGGGPADGALDPRDPVHWPKASQEAPAMAITAASMASG
jgi:hypothetical protein